MTRRLYALFLWICLAVSVLATTQRALAALGESAESIEADRKTLVAVRHATTARYGYMIQEVVSDANVVREYVSLSGIVFAIAWNGLSHPDLTPLLGSYAGEYRKALQQTPRQPGRRHVQVKASRVIVEKWGHMRDQQGRAYAPALMPSGVSVDEIK